MSAETSGPSGSERPRLLIIATLAWTGGVQTYITSLLPALVEHFDVTVAAAGPGRLGDRAEELGARYVSLRHVRRAIHPLHDVRGLVELVRLMRDLRPHIVHLNSSKMSVLGRIAAVLARVPIRIFTVHGWAFAAYSGLTSKQYLWADRLVRRLATMIICVADNQRELGIRMGTCTPERSVTIRNGVELAPVSSRTNGHTPARVISVGRLAYPKDFVTLARALGQLEPGSFEASIIGDGPDRNHLEHELDELGLDRSIRLLGERFDVPELLADADLFVLSSVSEALPMSVLEAMESSLPVVATAVGGVPELVAEAETGFLVAPGRADELAERIEQLIADPSLRRTMGSAGRTRAEREFSLEAFREAHLELYRRLLAKRRLPAP
jgi:glycosyltransferase involved in cell wall biosynthesis